MDSRFRRIQEWISVVVGVIALLAAMVGVWSSITKKTSTDVRTTAIEVEFNQLVDKVENLNQVTQGLHSQINAVSATLDKAAKAPNSLNNAKLSAELETFSLELKAIKSALGSDLERSLSVPLLRKDLVQLQAQLNERTAAASKEIDRIYDQNKWFLGLMGTMAIGLLGLAISNFLQSRKENG